MAEESGEEKGGSGITRRNLLFAGAAALGALFLGREAIKQNPFQERAQKLWEDYERNPQEFLLEYPNSVISGLSAGPNGVHLREIPSAQMGKEGVAGYLKPDEPVGTALIFPDQKPGPDGPFLTIKKDNRVVFVAERQLKPKLTVNP